MLVKNFNEDLFLEKSTEVLRAVAHPIRISIVKLLKDVEYLSVTEIYEKLNIEQAVASHHLRIMKDKGVLNMRRSGKNSLYFLSSDHFVELLTVLQKIYKVKVR